MYSFLSILHIYFTFFIFTRAHFHLNLIDTYFLFRSLSFSFSARLPRTPDFLAAIIPRYKATYTGPQIITHETGTCCYKGRNVRNVMDEGGDIWICVHPVGTFNITSQLAEVSTQHDCYTSHRENYPRHRGPFGASYRHARSVAVC